MSTSLHEWKIRASDYPRHLTKGIEGTRPLRKGLIRVEDEMEEDRHGQMWQMV